MQEIQTIKGVEENSEVKPIVSADNMDLKKINFAKGFWAEYEIKED